MVPLPNPRLYEAIAETKIKEMERTREESSDTFGRRLQLSRRTIVLTRLLVMLLIIVGIVIVYHLAH